VLPECSSALAGGGSDLGPVREYPGTWRPVPV